jgi:hypothetical protein
MMVRWTLILVCLGVASEALLLRARVQIDSVSRSPSPAMSAASDWESLLAGHEFGSPGCAIEYSCLTAGHRYVFDWGLEVFISPTDSPISAQEEFERSRSKEPGAYRLGASEDDWIYEGQFEVSAGTRCAVLGRTLGSLFVRVRLSLECGDFPYQQDHLIRTCRWAADIVARKLKSQRRH